MIFCDFGKLVILVNTNPLFPIFIFFNNLSSSASKSSSFFSDLNLNINFKLRIYIGGSTTYQDEEGSDADYWEPFFIIYDKKSCKRNEEIEKTFLKKPFYNSPVFTSKKPIFGMKWNSYVNLNLDKFISTSNIARLHF